jgi:oligopeptide transport system permease protein
LLWNILKSSFISLFIILVFILLLLLPREMQIKHISGMVFEASFPFSLGLYKERILDFIHHFRTNKGFGNVITGMPIIEEVKSLLPRDLLIIIPCFFMSMILGTVFGTLKFYYREKIFGKTFSIFSWLLSSIPDFFLFIAIQYLMIKLMRAGLPHFSLYGQEHWYNFIIPTIAITLIPLLHMAKYVSMSLESEASQEYVRTSYSKGLLSIHVILHMLKNSLQGIMNQTQIIMIYILTSLPIIEKLSSYRGASYQLLDSIQKNEDVRALAYMIPFLVIMFLTIVIMESLKRWVLPQIGGVNK